MINREREAMEKERTRRMATKYNGGREQKKGGRNERGEEWKEDGREGGRRVGLEEG